MTTAPWVASATRRRLRVVEGGRRSMRRALLPVAVLLVTAVFAVAAIQAYLSQEGFRASRLQSRVHTAEQQRELLRARVAELSSPARVRSAAEQLGMQPADDPVILPVPYGPPAADGGPAG